MVRRRSRQAVTARGLEQAEHSAIVMSSPDAIMGVTLAGVISSCNPAGADLYGWTAADIIGRRADVVVPPELRGEEEAIFQRAIAGDAVDDYRTDRLRRDGSIVPVSVTISPILDPHGTVSGAAIVTRRVSGTPDRVDGWLGARLDSDRTGDVRGRSRGAEEQFRIHMNGERAKERLQVHDAQDLFQHRMEVERAKERVDVEDAQDRFESTMDRERAKERHEVRGAQDRFQSRMGDERATERVRVQNAQDVFQIGMDAERSHAQSERERLQAQLQQSQRLEVLGQLAGGVAHDFNNLLAVILNYAAFVDEELTAGTEADFDAAIRDVRQIRRAAERASALTHQLLAFARREVVQPQVINLNDVVTDVQQMLDRTIGEDVLLHTALGPDLWPVLADVGQIEQLLMNLAVNARDAMTDGGTLTIDTENIVLGAENTVAGSADPADRRVRLRVCDTGTGMPSDVIDHVFEPFFTTKPDGTGTGLGLSTVYGIVSQAEATIDIHSVPGAGTTFTILIPVTDQPAVPAVDEPSSHRVPKGETILVVEDEEALREVTERIFASNGYHVITAANGADAVDIATRHEGDIHLLVTDVVMPEMLGKEVAERIRRLRPDIEVLFMSGYAQPVLASQGRLDPDVNLIDKPFSAASLIDKAGRVLNGHFRGFRTVEPPDAGT